MVDKVIGELPAISSLDATSLFVAEQSGQAVKVSGKQLTDFSNVETTAQVEQAKASAQEAKTAQAAAEAAILKGPIIQNGTWWVYNQTVGAYQDTGIKATGPQGIPGPTSSVNGISPDDSGNIALTAGDVNAYSKTEADTLYSNKGDTGLGFNGDLNTIIYWDDTDGTKFESSVDTLLLGMSRDISKRLKIVDYPACVVDGNGGYADIYSRDDKGNNASCTIVHYAVWSDGKIVIALKQKTEGVWYPWEYLNPPMALGVEYRTTERYLGKPVYVRLHDFGALPNGTFKEDSSPASWSIDKAICVYGTTSDGITIPTQNYAGQIVTGRHISMYFMRTEVTIATDGNGTNISATLFLKYTKTTD